MRSGRWRLWSDNGWMPATPPVGAQTLSVHLTVRRHSHLVLSSSGGSPSFLPLGDLPPPQQVNSPLALSPLPETAWFSWGSKVTDHPKAESNPNPFPPPVLQQLSCHGAGHHSPGRRHRASPRAGTPFDHEGLGAPVFILKLQREDAGKSPIFNR